MDQMSDIPTPRIKSFLHDERHEPAVASFPKLVKKACELERELQDTLEIALRNERELIAMTKERDDIIRWINHNRAAEAVADRDAKWQQNPMANALKAAVNDVATLRARISELEEDRERLDWLSSQAKFRTSDIHFKDLWFSWMEFKHPFRTAIDAAMKGEVR
jgi:hypothetical protein